MFVGPLEHLEQMLLQRVDRAGDEAGAGAQGEGAGGERPLQRALRAGGAQRPLPRGRRVLPLGEPVDLVVEQADLHVHVAAQDVERVVAADAQPVAVAGDHPDVELRVGELEAGGEGRGAAVDGVEAVGRHVVGEARGAADPRDEHGLLALDVQLGERLLDRFDDGVVAAAGAPAYLLVRGEVARPQLVGMLRRASHLTFPVWRRSPRGSRRP